MHKMNPPTQGKRITQTKTEIEQKAMKKFVELSEVGLSLNFAGPHSSGVKIGNAQQKLLTTYSLNTTTDWKINPIGWINELYQDQKLLTLLGLSWDYDWNTNIAFHCNYKYRVIMAWRQNGNIMRRCSSGIIRREVEKDVALQFCNWIHKEIDNLNSADCQMDSTESTEQGMENAIGEKKVNTIIVRDAPLAENPMDSWSQIKLASLASAQEKVEFNVLLNRWLQIDTFNFSVNDGNGTLLKTYHLPEFFYNNTDTPNQLPFHQFVMLQPNIEIMFKINSHKFAQGKYTISYVYDSKYMPEDILNNAGSYMRPHALIDLNESNEARLLIPYRAKAPFIFSVGAQTNFDTAYYVSVYLYTISSLRVPDGTPTTVPCSVFIRFPDTRFTGMRYYKPVVANAQMGQEISKDIVSSIKSVPVVGGLLGGAGKAMSHLALAVQRPFRSEADMKAVEERFKYVGLIGNRDKPTDYYNPQELRPNAAGNLAVGTNVVEPMNVCRLDPSATTIVIPDHQTSQDCSDLLQICQIWGYKGYIQWNISNKPKDLIFSQSTWPIHIGAVVNVNDKYKYTPVEMVSAFYMAYAGSLEYRFDFVCTQFHTGTIMIAWMPYNETYTYDQARSGYYKVFDLREQKSVTFVVPYVSNTVIRNFPRSSVVSQTGIAGPTPGNLTMWVVNPLTPIQSVATQMDILCFKRAGSDFQLYYPKTIKSFTSQHADITYGKEPLKITADAQMDDGEKENIDETPVFNTINSLSGRLQLNENHTNIKDLLRRWTPLNDTYTCTPGNWTTLQCLPTNIWANNTLQAFILNQFRWARGGLCFMLEAISGFDITTRCHILHVPQGNYFPDKNVKISASDVYEEGMAQQLWFPSINPTMKLEVPFFSAFNYLDLQQWSTQVYDKVLYNLGYFLIRSTTNNFAFKIWIRVADDFELFNFIGCNNITFTYNEGVTPKPPPSADGEMDHENILQDGDIEANPGPVGGINDGGIMEAYTSWLPSLDFPTKVWGGVKNISSNVMTPIRSVHQAAVTSGPAIKSLELASQAWQKTGEKTGEMMEYLKDIALNITATIKKSCTWVTNASSIFNAVLHFLNMVIKPSWQSFVISMTGVLTSIGSVFSDIGKAVFDWLLSRVRAPTEHPAGGANAEMDDEGDPLFSDDDKTTLCGLIFGAVSGFLGYKGTNPTFSRWTKILNMTNNFWRTISGATKFLDSLMTIFKKVFYWIVQRTPIAKNYFTLYSKNEEIKSYVLEAQFVTNEVNILHLEDDPAFKYRFWMTVVKSYQLQRQLITKPEPNTAALLRLIQKVIDKANELAVSMTACPVRYEPFVLNVCGNTKLGKSHMMQRTMPEFLNKAFELETKDSAIFVRTPGVEFWNGFRNQRGILYDDYLAVLDPSIAVSQVVELYNLKSSAIMNTNQAELNAKKIRANPYLVTLLQNNGFTVLNGTVEPRAFLRRSDSKWYASMATEYIGKSPKDLPEDVKKNYTYLRFQRYKDPADPESLETKRYTYKQWKNIVLEEMKKYHKQEIENMKDRMQVLLKTLPEEIQKYMSDVDPFSVFYAVANEAANKSKIQSGWLPCQQLNEMVKLQKNIYMKIQEFQNFEYVPNEEPAPPPVLHREEEKECYNSGFKPEFSGVINSKESIQLRTERMRKKINMRMPENLMEIYNNIIEQYNNQTSADGQFELPRLPDPIILGQNIKEMVMNLVFKPLDNVHLSEAVMGDCVICQEEKEYFAGCNASDQHRICLECYEGMLNAQGQLQCPMCRSTDFHQLKTYSMIDRFRPLYYARETMDVVMTNVKNAVTHPRRAFEQFKEWLERSPRAKLMLGASIVITYGLLMSHVLATEARNSHDRNCGLLSYMRVSHWHPKKANKWYGLLGWNDWYVDVIMPYSNEVRTEELTDAIQLIRDNNLSNLVMRNSDTIRCAVGHMDYDTPEKIAARVDRVEETWADMYDETDAQLQNPAPVIQPTLNGEVIAIVPDLVNFERSPLVKRQIPIGTPIPTGLDRCLHNELKMKMIGNPTQISFEMDFHDQKYKWWNDTTQLYCEDAPCQYDDCCFKDLQMRTWIIHRWAIVRNNTIRRVMADWRPPEMWPLPEELRLAETAAIHNHATNTVWQQIQQFANPTKHWTEYISDIWAGAYKALMIGLKIASAIAMVMKTISFAKWMFTGQKEEDPEPQIIGSGSIQTTKLTRTSKLPRQSTPVKAQMNESQTTSAINGITRNTFFLSAQFEEDGKEKTIAMRGLGLFGRVGFIPTHYAKYILFQYKRAKKGELKNFNLIIYAFKNKEIHLPVTIEEDSFAFTDSEHCYFKTPIQFPQFKDLTHLIPTQEEHKNVGSQYFHVEPSAVNDIVMKVEGTVKGTLDTLKINGTETFEAYDIFDVYVVSYGKKGSCGSAYINTTTKPLFAVHVAGNNSPYNVSGFGVPLIKEDIDKLKTGSSVLSFFVPTCADANIALPGAIVPITTIRKNQKVKMPEKTKIVNSLISDLFKEKPITQPAILSSRDPRWVWDKSPLYWGCLKHTTPPLPFNKGILNSTYEETRDKMITDLLPLKSVEPITYTEAITGIQDVEYYDSLDMSTSTGWPWNVGQKKTKSDWIKFERNGKGFMTNVVIDPELLSCMEMKAQMRSRGIRPFTVFIDWLKDERRKASKLEKPDGTRIFSLSPIDFTIQLRQFTLDFCASFMDNRLTINSIVGINPDGPEWSKLANTLLHHSKHIITFDYSDFGPRLPSDVGAKAMEIMIDWYERHGPEEVDYRTNLKVMGEELFQAYHLMNDFVYQTVCGAPSGASTTVIHNTLVNILMMRYIWKFIILTQNIDPTYLSLFDENVCMYLYGDDGIMSVKEQVLPWFNLKAIMRAFQMHDIIITDAEKLASRKRGEEIPNWDKIPLSQTLEESTVLKRGFKKHPKRKNHWLAPLDEVSIKEACRWIWKSPDERAATLVNCEQSILLSYGHGPEYFNNWKYVVNSKLSEIGLPLITKTWHDIDINFFGESEIHGSFIPGTWDGGAYGLMVEKHKGTRNVGLSGLMQHDQSEGKDALEQSSRQNGHVGLNANVVEVRDVDLINVERIIDNRSGGYIPSALNFELECSPSLTMDLSGGDNNTQMLPFPTGS